MGPPFYFSSAELNLFIKLGYMLEIDSFDA
jgi:hypothetical protein